MITKFLYRVFCGFFLGLSIFAPGFSGSVVAIIMGVYQDLLRIVSNPFKKLKENIAFCAPLAVGALISAVLFVIAFNFLFDTYEKAIYLLFVGLVCGNLPVIWGEVKKCGFQRRYIATGILAAAFSLCVLMFGTVQPADSGGSAGLLIVALGGLVAGVVAFIPGMSISMILILMGVYSLLITYAESLLHFDFTHLVPLALFFVCAVVGLALASKAIRAVFRKFPGVANSAVLGFMIGSLTGIFIQGLRIEDANFSWLIGVIMLAAGLLVSALFVKLSRVMEKPESAE